MKRHDKKHQASTKSNSGLGSTGSKLKIAFFELEEWEKDYIRQNLKGQRLVFVDGKLAKETAAKAKSLVPDHNNI